MSEQKRRDENVEPVESDDVEVVAHSDEEENPGCVINHSNEL